MPGPLIADPTPDWLKPENASVTDSALTKAMRMMAHVIGADNPSAQVFNWMTTELPGGEVQGGIAKAMEGLKGRVQNAIKAYHGSPHDFEQFSLSKIGTGEGAQAYGHGLYFAENPETAQAYRDQLAGHKVLIDNKPWTEAAKDLTVNQRAALAYADNFNLKLEDMDANTLGDAYRWAAHGDATPGKVPRPSKSFDTFKADWQNLTGRVQQSDPRGKMYEVAIHADPEDFLDWDKPLSQQSEKVKAALKRAGKWPTGDKLDVGRGALPEDLKGSDVAFRSEDTSQRLRDAGIPGIKYLDQGSRGTHSVIPKNGEWGILKPDGNEWLQELTTKAAAEAKAKSLDAFQRTSNYVVFDDKLIDIQKKYAALLAAGLSAEEARRQATK